MAADRPRCFVALTLDLGSRDVLAALPVARGARRTPREQLHLTLAFLGAIERMRAERLGTALPALVAAGDALPGVEVERVVCWPSTAHARLVVAELGRSPALIALSERVDRELDALGLPADSRAFRPHVTIARFARHAKPDPVARDETAAPLAVRFERLTLFESILSHVGVEHRVLASAALPA